MRLPVALAVAAVLALAGGASGAPRTPQTAGGTAHAVALQVLVPGQAGAVRGSVSAPPDAVSFGGSFAYGDGSAVTAGSLTASASATAGTDATSSASSEVDSLSLFGGEVTVGSAVGKAHGVTSKRTATGDFAGASVSGLVVDGVATTVGPNQRIALGDWGYAIALEQSSAPGGTPAAQSYRGFVTALDIHLTAAHGSLPAGSEILVGYAEADVQASAAPPPPPEPPKTKPKVRAHAKKIQPKAPEPKRGLPKSPLTRPLPPGVTPKLTAGGYVFPVYGPSSFTDTFGAARADVSYHHGDDIFAPLGAPLLACADGTIFSVGWNEVGGNRLWLRDAQGNEFYYAHLSAFSPLAVNGKHVHAGEVVGFVGNTGDAAGTPYHLHFEIHPVSLLYLGYDGAVDPTTYLNAWKKLRDVRFTAVAGWVPSVASSNPAPKPGAILLQSSDISSADGLDPGSLQRAVVAPAKTEGAAPSVFSGPLG